LTAFGRHVAAVSTFTVHGSGQNAANITSTGLESAADAIVKADMLAWSTDLRSKNSAVRRKVQSGEERIDDALLFSRKNLRFNDPKTTPQNVVSYYARQESNLQPAD
jgi:hypothetical protein